MNERIKRMLSQILWVLDAQLGVNPVRMLVSIRGIPRFVRDLFRFRAGYAGPLSLMPCLQDWSAENGSAANEYFWQDLIVAQRIFDAQPRRHVDIGSRVDGFVAHVASFREIEIFDLRPTRTDIPRVTVRQADIMNTDGGLSSYCDSLSCLHALEHFGLGRYGDRIDPEGYLHGFASMVEMLESGGTFYLSVPIGHARVEFNAHRVFDPRRILQIASAHSLQLVTFFEVTAHAAVERSQFDEAQIARMARQSYALGLFIFSKTRSS